MLVAAEVSRLIVGNHPWATARLLMGSAFRVREKDRRGMLMEGMLTLLPPIFGRRKEVRGRGGNAGTPIVATGAVGESVDVVAQVIFEQALVAAQCDGDVTH